MSSPFLTDFDTILEQILIDYQNLDPSPDVSEGSIAFISAACLASAIYGLTRYQDYIANQIFPDTADTNNLNHWGAVYGISRNTGEIDSAYAARILSFIQSPPEGGDVTDYVSWATSVQVPLYNNENFLPSAVNLSTSVITTTQDWSTDTADIPDIVTLISTGYLPGGLNPGTQYYVINYASDAIQLSLTRSGSAVTITSYGTGVHTLIADTTTQYKAQNVTIITPNSAISPTSAGTVSIIIDPNTTTNSMDSNVKNSYINSGASATLTNAVYNYVENLRPVTANTTNVKMTSTLPVTILVIATPNTLTNNQLSTISNDISAYIDTMLPGQTLYVSKIISIAINGGAVDAGVALNAFSSNITPTAYQTITAQSITVNV